MLKSNSAVASKMAALKITVDELLGTGAVKRMAAAKREIRKIRTGALFAEKETFCIFILPDGMNKPTYLTREFVRDGQVQKMDYVIVVSADGTDKEMSLNSLTNPYIPFVDGELLRDKAQYYTGSFIDDWKSHTTTEAALKAIDEKQNAGWHIKVKSATTVHTAFIPNRGENRGIPQERDQMVYELDWELDPTEGQQTLQNQQQANETDAEFEEITDDQNAQQQQSDGAGNAKEQE